MDELTNVNEVVEEAAPAEETFDSDISDSDFDAMWDDDDSNDTGDSGGNARQPGGLDVESDDEIYNKALEVVRATRRASTSHLQRRMKIGYNHAARLIDMLEERGVIGPARGAGPREILVDLDAPQVAYQSSDAESTAPAETPPVPEI